MRKKKNDMDEQMVDINASDGNKKKKVSHILTCPCYVCYDAEQAQAPNSNLWIHPYICIR